jgi:hypothetical protein
MSGGFPIAVGAIGGAALGFAVGEPTACFLIGLALGIAAAVAIWLIDRRR